MTLSHGLVERGAGGRPDRTGSTSGAGTPVRPFPVWQDPRPTGNAGLFRRPGFHIEGATRSRRMIRAKNRVGANLYSQHGDMLTANGSGRCFAGAWDGDMFSNEQFDTADAGRSLPAGKSEAISGFFVPSSPVGTTP